jgi:hypothetical protein
MIRNQLETSRINAVRLFKHEPCRTLVGLSRVSTPLLRLSGYDVDGRDEARPWTNGSSREEYYDGYHSAHLFHVKRSAGYL